MGKTDDGLNTDEPFYHWTNQKNTIERNGFSVYGTKKFRHDLKYGHGVYLCTNPQDFSGHGKKLITCAVNVSSPVRIKKNGFIFTVHNKVKDFCAKKKLTKIDESILRKEMLRNFFITAGADSVYEKLFNLLAVFDPKKVRVIK